MSYQETIIDLLNRSHSPYHVVDNIRQILDKEGYTRLDEKEVTPLEPNTRYYVIRNKTSLIAFITPKEKIASAKIIACHSDSPSFKIKSNPVIKTNDLIRLNVDPYGGMIKYSWFDRPLSIAGRIITSDGDVISQSLLDIDEDLCTIPSLCVHQTTAPVNDNPAVDLLPLISQNPNFDFNRFISEKAGIGDSKLLGYDLWLYAREAARLIGENKEFLSSPRLDDLASSYSTLLGFIESGKEAIDGSVLKVYAIFDNEEVGSQTYNGAESTFLKDVLRRICNQFAVEYEKVVANSFLLSVDNGHAMHPAHPENSDYNCDIKLNAGIMIKDIANRQYTTDGLSAALVKAICIRNGLPYQEFTNKNTVRCGRTLGRLSNTQVSLLACDIGLPQLAMHSSNELCGIHDLDNMVDFIRCFEAENYSFVGETIVFNK